MLLDFRSPFPCVIIKLKTPVTDFGDWYCPGKLVCDVPFHWSGAIQGSKPFQVIIVSRTNVSKTVTVSWYNYVPQKSLFRWKFTDKKSPWARF